MAAETKHIHSRVDEELYRDLVDLAKELGFQDVSKLIRHVLTKFVKAEKQRLAEEKDDIFK